MSETQSIIFGPVRSRRFGRSLGVDLSPKRKQCNFDCVYCELKGAKPMEAMSDVVSVEEVIRAVQGALEQYRFDVLTLTANGEPTLYPHLQELVSTLKHTLPDSVKILLLTNGSLLWKAQVRKALSLLDMVKFSCDSLDLRAFKKIDRPHKSLELERIKEGIGRFCADFSGEKIAEVLFVKGINDMPSHARSIAEFLSTLRLERVDIGSIDRPPAYKVEALKYEELRALADIFGEFETLRGRISLPTRHNATSHNAISHAFTLDSTSTDTMPPEAARLDTKRADSKGLDSEKYVDAGLDLKEKSESSRSCGLLDTYFQARSGVLAPCAEDCQSSQAKANLACYDEKSLLGLIARRPLSKEDAYLLLAPSSLALLEALCQKGAIKLCAMGEDEFYTLA